MDLVFLDANVLFSSAWKPDADSRRLWRQSGVSLRTSEYAIAEARRNLADAERRARLEALLPGLTIVPAGPPRILRRDSLAGLPMDDVPILLAAIASRSTHLLTGNTRDFGRLYGRRVGGVLVLRPREYLDLLRGQ